MFNEFHTMNLCVMWDIVIHLEIIFIYTDKHNNLITHGYKFTMIKVQFELFQ